MCYRVTFKKLFPKIRGEQFTVPSKELQDIKFKKLYGSTTMNSITRMRNLLRGVHSLKNASGIDIFPNIIERQLSKMYRLVKCSLNFFNLIGYKDHQS